MQGDFRELSIRDCLILNNKNHLLLIIPAKATHIIEKLSRPHVQTSENPLFACLFGRQESTLVKAHVLFIA